MQNRKTQQSARDRDTKQANRKRKAVINSVRKAEQYQREDRKKAKRDKQSPERKMYIKKKQIVINIESERKRGRKERLKDKDREKA